MKQLFAAALFMCTFSIFGQTVFGTVSNGVFTQTISQSQLRQKVVEKFSLSESDIKLLDIRVVGGNRVVYVKTYSNTTSAHMLQTNSDGTVTSFVPIGGGPGTSITCTGRQCSECDIEGLPNPKDIYCSCTRPNGNDPACDMTKSISLPW